jgi:heterodisulfide reductase subunit C
MRSIDFSELDTTLPEKVKALNNHVERCYQCGTCTASCPVFEVNPEYDPRKIIRMLLLGVKSVLTEEFVWLCATCYACQERCPQGVLVPDVMRALTNIAALKGLTPEHVQEQCQQVKTKGVLYSITPYVNRKRKRLGLPEIEQKYTVEKIFEE